VPLHFSVWSVFIASRRLLFPLSVDGLVDTRLLLLRYGIATV
jgi:hypothetical protein